MDKITSFIKSIKQKGVKLGAGLLTGIASSNIVVAQTTYNCTLNQTTYGGLLYCAIADWFVWIVGGLILLGFILGFYMITGRKK